MSGGVVWSHKVVGKDSTKTENIQMASMGAILNSKYTSHKAAKSMDNTYQEMYVDLRTVVCLLRGDGTILRPLSTHGHLTILRNKTQQKQPGSLSAPIPA